MLGTHLAHSEGKEHCVSSSVEGSEVGRTASSLTCALIAVVCTLDLLHIMAVRITFVGVRNAVVATHRSNGVCAATV